jgi:RNA-directed DNA polymerase
MGLRLSEEKTKITHIDEGVDFLGWRIQRHRKRGTNRRHIYWYPARKAVQAITGKVKMLCRRMDTNQPLDALLRQLNPALRGWCALWVPESRRTSCDLLILVDEPAEAVVSFDLVDLGCWATGEWS